MRLAVVLISFLLALGSGAEQTQPFALRGYYMTFMRMPLWGLPQWKQALDCVAADGGNTVILWMAGAFRSSKYPITWEYNREHENIQDDFGNALIDYAHRKGIRVLLGFTPFGYDGVNQYSISHPELKARKTDGSPVDAFGIHCWGWSLCPSQPESQRFMLEYTREMIRFYPAADGLLIESSDYNLCRCSTCSSTYYEKEFSFVRQISVELWAANPSATIVVFPHYFSGKKVNAGTDIEATAAQFELDPRWTLIFTPHSAHLQPELVKRAASTIYWNDGPSIGTPSVIRDGARTARTHSLSGYIPSLEPFSYIMPRPEFGAGAAGTRVKQLGLAWLTDHAMSLTSLPIRLQRLAYREFTRNPDLTEEGFQATVARELFGSPSSLKQADDLLFLQRIVNDGRTWSSSSPYVDPDYFAVRSKRESWPADRITTHQKTLERVRQLPARYVNATQPNEQEMRRIAEFIAARWNAAAN